MVKFCLLFICLCCLCGKGMAEEPIVEASTNATSHPAHQPIEGTITITHRKTEIIDDHSFTQEGQPLQVSFVRDVPLSAQSDLMISIFSFQLPGQDKGFYVLPAITVKVGDKNYHSIPSTYEVREEAIPSTSPTAAPALTTPIIFRLEAMVKGPTTLYPGQRTTLFYRISYNRSVDLTRSVLPLVHPAHFQKVGDVHIQDYQKENITIQELTQEVEASELGTFQLGPSVIEGYAYSFNSSGQKVYDPNLLHAEAPAVTLEVKPFPSAHQPASFTGALGQIKVEASLESSPTVTVGDTMQLQVSIQGVTNLTELHLPPLQCQPGFSGFFQMSDLPPPAEIKGESKIFHLELIPLLASITQVPPIEVSSFDPKEAKYVIQKTDPIPLTVSPYPMKPFTLQAKERMIPLRPIEKLPTSSLMPLETYGKAVQIGDLKVSWTQSLNVFWILPLGLALLFLQRWEYQRWQRQRPKIHVPTSEELLKRALKSPRGSLESLQLLEQAFWWRLWEKGMLPHGVSRLEQLPQEGHLGAVRSFLFELQMLQYGQDKTYDFFSLQQQAKRLFKDIGSIMEHD